MGTHHYIKLAFTTSVQDNWFTLTNTSAENILLIKTTQSILNDISVEGNAV